MLDQCELNMNRYYPKPAATKMLNKPIIYLIWLLGTLKWNKLNILVIVDCQCILVLFSYFCLFKEIGDFINCIVDYINETTTRKCESSYSCFLNKVVSRVNFEGLCERKKERCLVLPIVCPTPIDKNG